jgi:hypothetical protein
MNQTWRTPSTVVPNYTRYPYMYSSMETAGEQPKHLNCRHSPFTQVSLVAMVRGLPHPFEGKGASGKKAKSDRGEVTEADPLLPPNPGARTIQTSFSGTFRARRSSRSPNTPNFPMDSSPSSRQHGLGDGHRNQRSLDGYIAYNEDTSRASSASYTGPATVGSTNPQGVPNSSIQQSDAATPDRQERKAGMYRPNPITETPQQRGGGHPPLLEIPEEVYAVRKAALQVLKPLTSSWVSRLNPVNFF